MTRLLFALVLLALAPAARAQQTTTLLDADALASNPVLHDGSVAYLRATPDGGTRLVRLDPATGRTTETPIPDPADGWSYGSFASVAGRLHIESTEEDTGARAWVALDGPAFQPVPADPALATVETYTLVQFSEAGARALVALQGEDEAGRLAEVGADGRVTPLEPAPSPGYRGVSHATPLGDAVYFVVGTPDGSGYAYALWRAAGGQAAPADVLPAGATVSALAAAGGALLVAAVDPETQTSRIYRLAPDAARAVPVPGTEQPFSYSDALFRALGDVLFFTASDPDDDDAGDGGPRQSLYRQRGTAAPERVAGLDLGPAALFSADAARTFGGALYIAAYTPADDPYGTLRSLFRVGPDGPPQLAVRIEGESVYPQFAGYGAAFVVAESMLYTGLQVDGDVVLVSVPLAGTAPASGPAR